LVNLTKITEAERGECATLAHLMSRVQTCLRAVTPDNSLHEARILVAHGLGLTSNQTLFEQARAVTVEEDSRVMSLVNRRLNHEPIAYIIGTREFWSLDFKVGLDCLIPRPDSEILVEAGLDSLPSNKPIARVLDLGTGSGCLLLSTLHENPRAIGVGVDLSHGAVVCAKANALRLKLENRAHFMVGHWTSALKGGFDLILCNPPYIRACDIAHLMPDVSLYEPHSALDGGSDGLATYREIAPQLGRQLFPKGKICIEVGKGQSDGVRKIFEGHGLVLETQRKDLGGILRCLIFANKIN